jgi:hypothetical protein
MDATSLENACRLSIEWLRAQAGAALAGQAMPPSRQQDPLYQSTFRTFAHSPRPMRRSLMRELELTAPELFEGVRSTVFRSWDKPTIVSDFVLRWALAHGLAQMRTYRHRHVSTGDVDQQAQLQALAVEFGSLDFFCINDTTDDAHAQDPRLQQVQSVLQAMLPQASGFEQSGGGASDTHDSQKAQSAEIHQGTQAPAAHQSKLSGTRRRA